MVQLRGIGGFREGSRSKKDGFLLENYWSVNEVVVEISMLSENRAIFKGFEKSFMKNWQLFQEELSYLECRLYSSYYPRKRDQVINDNMNSSRSIGIHKEMVRSRTRANWSSRS